MSRITLKCDNCGKEFDRDTSQAKIAKRHFCSVTCQRNAYKGAGNPTWKGGRCVGAGGYVFAFKPDHPFAYRNGRVLEHRLVMEKKLGRLLEKGEVVHHINNIKSDNRLENLTLFASDIEHRRVGHSKKVVCRICGKPQHARGLCSKHYDQTEQRRNHKHEYGHVWRKEHREYRNSYRKEFRKRKENKNE